MIAKGFGAAIWFTTIAFTALAADVQVRLTCPIVTVTGWILVWLPEIFSRFTWRG